MTDYNLPLGIDTTDIVTGFDKIEQGLSDITVSAQNAGDAITEVMMKSAGSSDQLIKKLGAGADAAVKFKSVAKEVGIELNKTFSGETINPTAITGKVNVLVAKMKDVIGKPIDFKFNFDKTTMELLVSKLKEAKGQTEAFEVVINAAKNRLGDLVKGSKPFNELNKQIQDADKFLNTLKDDVVELKDELAQPIPPVDPIPEKVEPKVKSLKAQLREMKAELTALDLAGKSGSDRFAELSTKAGILEDQIGDTNQRIKALANDTAGLNAGITAIRGLAGAFAVAQGSLAAFGETNEEVAATIQKVQGAMAILQGIQEVANVLNKDSALIVYLQSLAHKQNTAAVVAETTAVAADAAATEAATVATNSWTAALLANPITAIIAAIAIGAAIIYNFAKSEDEATAATRRLNDELERQQKFLTEDIKIIERHQKVREAQAEFDRKKQSEITQTQIGALRSRARATIEAIEEDKKFLQASNGVRDEDIAARKAANERIRDLESELRDINAEGNALLIKVQVQRREEENKLAKELLAQRIANADAQRAILKLSQEYANQILNLQNDDLKNAKAKELAILQQSASEKIATLEEEGKERLRLIEKTRKELLLDIESDPAVLKLKQKGLNDQIKMEEDAAKKRAELVLAIREDQRIKEAEITEKYKRQQLNLYLDIDEQLLTVQRESFDRQLELNNIAAERKILAIKAQNLEIEDEVIAINAVNEELQAKDFQTSFEFDAKKIELDKQTNINRINEAKEFSGRSAQVQALRHIMELRAELEAAEKQLQLLKDYGRTASDLEYQNAVARVNAAKKAVADAVENKPPLTIGQLLFPEASEKELQNIEENARQLFSSLGTITNVYSQLVQDEYKKIIDAKKAAVAADDEALQTLDQQLQKELELREQGLANNVEAIRQEMAAKSEARERDVKEQEEAQKRLAQSQKAQADAQAILQGANLITSATNIYLKATEVGGPIGVAVASFAIAAMIGAFAAQRAAAANATKQSFGMGGEVDGNSHEHGGHKYYSHSPGGGVVELEGGEWVTNRQATKKYKPLLQAINNNSLERYTEKTIQRLLEGTGVHIAVDEEKSTVLEEANTNNIMHINNTVIAKPDNNELKSIDKGIQRLVENTAPKETVYEEGDFIVRKKGNKTIKTRKK